MWVQYSVIGLIGGKMKGGTTMDATLQTFQQVNPEHRGKMVLVFYEISESGNTRVDAKIGRLNDLGVSVSLGLNNYMMVYFQEEPSSIWEKYMYENNGLFLIDCIPGICYGIVEGVNLS